MTFNVMHDLYLLQSKWMNMKAFPPLCVGYQRFERLERLKRIGKIVIDAGIVGGLPDFWWNKVKPEIGVGGE